MTNDRTILSQPHKVAQPSGDAACTHVDIAVCTHRRSGLACTLASLGELAVPDGVICRIVVADNDAEPSARALTAEWAERIPHAVVYVHCPAHNISVARNACLETAEGEWIAFIDDDEEADRGWLGALLGMATETGAAAVLGPVNAVYGKDAPRWMAEGDFHSTRPVRVRGEIRTGYAGNLLLNRRSVEFAALRFDPDLGCNGGEDTAFLSALWNAGGKIAFAPEAMVHEPVPIDRASLGWLLRRRYQFGQNHGLMLTSKLPQDRRRAVRRATHAAFAGSKALACLTLMLATWPSPIWRRRNLLRGILHLGVVAALLGLSTPELYLWPTAERSRETSHAA